MYEYLIRYTLNGQRKELEFTPEPGHAAPFDFVRAVVKAENPRYEFKSKTAEAALKENGIMDMTHLPRGGK